MAVSIKTLNDREMSVNNKQVIKDMNGNWISNQELTPSEEKAINRHIQSL